MLIGRVVGTWACVYTLNWPDDCRTVRLVVAVIKGSPPKEEEEDSDFDLFIWLIGNGEREKPRMVIAQLEDGDPDDKIELLWALTDRKFDPGGAAGRGGYSIAADIGAVLGLVSVAIAKELVIADEGKRNYSIIVAVDATIQDNYTAQMLKRYIRELSGADLPIVPDTAPLSENKIIVGFNRHSMKFGAGGSRYYTPSWGST